jgi:dienelactone hydrolase
LAADAVAAFKYLQSRPEVDPNKIGFRGASQSGYVLPIAASMEPKVAFIVLLSPPMVTPYKQILFNVEAELRDANFSDQQVNQALMYTRAGLDYARTGKRWDAYEQLGNEAKNSHGSRSQRDPNLKMTRCFHGFI